jgi:hypothetical protein
MLIRSRASQKLPIRDPLDALWGSYLRTVSLEEPFELTGEEYGCVMERRCRDARAAAISLDLGLRVTGLGPGSQPAEAERYALLSEEILAGTAHEVACMKYLGSVPDDPDTVLPYLDEDWSSFRFAREQDVAPLPEPLRRRCARRLAIRV